MNGDFSENGEIEGDFFSGWGSVGVEKKGGEEQEERTEKILHERVPRKDKKLGRYGGFTAVFNTNEIGFDIV
jgi:hypothetical protein